MDKSAYLQIGVFAKISGQLDNNNFWFQMAREANLPETRIYLALNYLSIGRFEEAKEAVIDLALDNNIDAIAVLAFISVRLNDLEGAIEWWEIAARSDDPVALYNLGLQEARNGNRVRTIELFERAASFGSAQSMNRLADIAIQDGDEVGAIRWWERSAALNDEFAISELGKRAFARNDMAKAFYWAGNAISGSVTMLPERSARAHDPFPALKDQLSNVSVERIIVDNVKNFDLAKVISDSGDAQVVIISASDLDTDKDLAVLLSYLPASACNEKIICYQNQSGVAVQVFGDNVSREVPGIFWVEVLRAYGERTTPEIVSELASRGPLGRQKAIHEFESLMHEILAEDLPQDIPAHLIAKMMDLLHLPDGFEIVKEVFPLREGITPDSTQVVELTRIAVAVFLTDPEMIESLKIVMNYHRPEFHLHLSRVPEAIPTLEAFGVGL